MRFERFFCLRDFLRRPPTAGAGASGAGVGAEAGAEAGAGAGAGALLPALLPAFLLAFFGVFNPDNGSAGLPAGNDNDPPILF